MANLEPPTSEVAEVLTKGGRGCPLCYLWSRDESSILERTRARAGSDKAMMERVLGTSGFCNRHTHTLREDVLSSDDDFSYAPFARTVLGKLEEDLGRVLVSLKERPAGKEVKGEEPLAETIAQLEKSIGGTAVCPVCAELLESDKGRVAGLLQLLESKELAETYTKSEALCMPHFVSVIQTLARASVQDAERTWGLLVRTQLASFEATDHLLNERMKKYSWDYRNEGITPEEAGAQKRAMLAIAGAEGLYCRPRKTSLRPARVWY